MNVLSESTDLLSAQFFAGFADVVRCFLCNEIHQRFDVVRFDGERIVRFAGMERIQRPFDHRRECRRDPFEIDYRLV